MNEHDDETAPSELDLLKDRARLMGVPFSGNIGVETLKARIEAKMNGEPAVDEKTSDDDADKPVRKSKLQLEQETRDRLQEEKMKLVRCRIYNLNPQKRDTPGEYVTVRNRFLGEVTKMIPFGEATDNGYHVPQVLVDELKSRKYQAIRTWKDEKGQLRHKARMVPEYSIEILPDLTEEEMKSLAVKQAAAKALAGDDD